MDGDGWNTLVLHLERENLFRKDYETLEKLFVEREAIIPEHVIGIMNVKSIERMQELIYLAQQMCKIENVLLVFRTPSSGKYNGLCDEVYAYLLNNKNVIDTKVAYISEISGLLYMFYEDER
ncbi:hypothetical protein QR721_06545 [Aciduricibacillus chroicocephali]|uniref:Uncharacterized protein n=1 Tax=Aciduricibacillus chroicocephali TaxID=3054939 RepID=A0ABY9KYM6_9BACI|nr:hypothetical protein QR721_06545 [Bacillaceae bacterium 44XB]